MTESVWLVRHASTAWSGRRWCGRTDLPLTPGGEAEARALAARLAEELPDDVGIDCSPLRRARATALPIAWAVRGAHRIQAALREVDFGRAEGLAWPELERTLPTLARDLARGRLDVDWPGGDSAAETRARVREVWRGVERSKAACLVLVTHGGTIAALLAEAVPETGGGMVPTASALPLRRTDDGWRSAGSMVVA